MYIPCHELEDGKYVFPLKLVVLRVELRIGYNYNSPQKDAKKWNNTLIQMNDLYLFFRCYSVIHVCWWLKSPHYIPIHVRGKGSSHVKSFTHCPPEANKNLSSNIPREQKGVCVSSRSSHRGYRFGSLWTHELFVLLYELSILRDWSLMLLFSPLARWGPLDSRFYQRCKLLFSSLPSFLCPLSFSLCQLVGTMRGIAGSNKANPLQKLMASSGSVFQTDWAHKDSARSDPNTCEKECRRGCQNIQCQKECQKECQHIIIYYICQIECQQECQIKSQNVCQIQWQEECQIDRQNLCQIECQQECQIKCQNVCQIQWQEECQIDCQNLCHIECQIECQNICQIMSDTMPGRMPIRMSDRLSARTPGERSEYMSGTMPGRIPNRMSEYMSHRIPDRMSEYMSDRMSARMPDEMSEYMSDRMPEIMSEICQIECQQEFQIQCQNVCQIECQNKCQIECQQERQMKCQNICQIQCQEGCRIECPNICHIECHFLGVTRRK